MPGMQAAVLAIAITNQFIIMIPCDKCKYNKDCVFMRFTKGYRFCPFPPGWEDTLDKTADLLLSNKPIRVNEETGDLEDASMPSKKIKVKPYRAHQRLSKMTFNDLIDLAN